MIRYTILSLLFIKIVSTGFFRETAEDQRACLMDFYDATDGPNWGNNKLWGSRFHPCGTRRTEAWANLLCDEIGGNIKNFRMSANMLKGVLSGPASCVFDIMTLECFVVSTNFLSGSLPANFGTQSSYHIEIAGNQFTEFPKVFYPNTHDNVRLLGQQNAFTGTIPATMPDMVADADLWANPGLECTIPECILQAWVCTCPDLLDTNS